MQKEDKIVQNLRALKKAYEKKGNSTKKST